MVVQGGYRSLLFLSAEGHRRRYYHYRSTAIWILSIDCWSVVETPFFLALADKNRCRGLPGYCWLERRKDQRPRVHWSIGSHRNRCSYCALRRYERPNCRRYISSR